MRFVRVANDALVNMDLVEAMFIAGVEYDSDGKPLKYGLYARIGDNVHPLMVSANKNELTRHMLKVLDNLG